MSGRRLRWLGSSRVVRVVTVVSLAMAAMTLAPSTASAEAAAQISIDRLSGASANSGTAFTYDVDFSCSAVDDLTCHNSVISIPLVGAMPSWSYAAEANPRVASAAVVGSNYVITLMADVPAGSTTQVRLSVTPTNWTTPNNTAFSLLPSVSGDNIATVTAPAAATATATAAFDVAVKKLAQDTSAARGTVPFRWSITICDPSSALAPGGDLTFTSASVVDTLPAGVVYTITAHNVGNAPGSASFADSLVNVIDDAGYNDDASADVGTVSYAKPVLNWSATLAAGQLATIRYSVTVNSTQTGDLMLDNSVLGQGPGSNCAVAPVPAQCQVVIALQLASTGVDAEQLALSALIALGLGTFLVITGRRRRSY